jgi:hypothetical protein
LNCPTTSPAISASTNVISFGLCSSIIMSPLFLVISSKPNHCIIRPNRIRKREKNFFKSSRRRWTMAT